MRERKSLTNTARKHQLQRITQENQRLLQRIQQVNPIIDHLEFEVRAKKNEYLKRQLSEFRAVPLPPQIETWLLEKNKQLHASRTESEDVGGVCASPPRDRGGSREVYTRGGATTSTSMRRSQSARTYQEEEILEGREEETSESGGHNQERVGRRKTTSTTSRRRKSSKQKGRKTAAGLANTKDTSKGSPMRGRIRPKSGRI